MRRKPEKIEENKFVTKVNRAGGEAIKLSTQGMYGKRGFNDRCAFMYPGVTALFEFKRKGEKAKKLQKARHRKFKKMEIPCYVVFTCAKAWRILTRLVKEAKKKRALGPDWYDSCRLQGVRTKKLPARVH